MITKQVYCIGGQQLKMLRIQHDLARTKQEFLSLLEAMIKQGILSPQEMNRYVKPLEDTADPEFIRQDLEEWYRNLGIESILNREFSLSPCPFTREEIEEVHRNTEIILCVPANVTREELGKLFRLDSWAIHDPLVARGTESADFWFRTSMSLQPGYLYQTGIQIKHLFLDEGKVHFSLERYLVFVARIRHLLKQTPDSQYWIWLPHRAYDRSGMLIAGFDHYGSLSIHGWMPQFSASFLGARYGLAPRRT